MTFRSRVKSVSKWLGKDRFKNTKRSWDANKIVSFQGSQAPPEYMSNRMANKFWNILENAKKNGICEYTYGALDPLQVTQMAPHLNSVYVSGWQTSSTASMSYLFTVSIIESHFIITFKCDPSSLLSLVPAPHLAKTWLKI